ncbi:MAG: enoyl-CoA hydratase/isomerase family protein [Mycobacteriales bacterium]
MENPDAGVAVVEDGAVLRLTLDRPKAGNSIGRATTQALLEALDLAMDSSRVRVIALSATGKDFCSGVDLKEANAPTAEKPRVGHISRRIATSTNRLVQAFAEVQIPVVVGVRGWAAGVGNTLALSGDYIVASETARFWTPFVTRGFSPDSGSTYLLPRLIGPTRAKEMLMLGRPVDAPKALGWGMVNEVVADDTLEDAFERAVAEFASAATVAVGCAKNLVHRNLEVDLGHALANEAAMEEVSLRSEDFKLGITAFATRQPVEFTGR